MTGALLVLGCGYLGIGLNRAVAYAKARRRLFETLIVDPSRAAEAALSTVRAFAALPRWKRLAASALRFPVDVTTWPVSEVLEVVDRRRRPDRREALFRDTRWLGSEEDLTPEYLSKGQRRQSLTTCAAAVLLVVVATRTSLLEDAVQVRLLVWVVVLGTASRQVLDLLAEKFLTTTARRSGRPLPYAYLDVIMTAAADLVTLTLCSVLLLRWTQGRPLQLGWFREQLLAVIGGAHLWQDLHRSSTATVIGLSTLTFYASLVEPIKSVIGRHRSGDELMAAAANALRRGNTDRAAQLLETGRTRNPSPRLSAQAEGLLALSQGRPQDAWKAARATVRLFRPLDDVDMRRQQEDGLFVLLHWSDLLTIRPRPPFIKLAAEAQVRDSMMSCLVVRHAKDVLPDGEPRAVALASLLPAPAWPMAFSAAHHLDGDATAALRSLPPATGLTGADLIWRNILARDLEADHTSLDKTVPATRALLADIAGSPPTTWPLWLKFAVGVLLSAPLVLATRIDLDDDLAAEVIKARKDVNGDLADTFDQEVVRRLATGGRSA